MCAAALAAVPVLTFSAHVAARKLFVSTFNTPNMSTDERAALAASGVAGLLNALPLGLLLWTLPMAVGAAACAVAWCTGVRRRGLGRALALAASDPQGARAWAERRSN